MDAGLKTANMIPLWKKEIFQMKSNTEAIFDGVINELDRQNFFADDDPEHKASAELEATLSPEQSVLFDRFIEAYTENEVRIRREAYGRGLKVGIRLGYEAGTYDPNEK